MWMRSVGCVWRWYPLRDPERKEIDDAFVASSNLINCKLVTGVIYYPSRTLFTSRVLLSSVQLFIRIHRWIQVCCYSWLVDSRLDLICYCFAGRNGDAPPSYDAIFGSPPGGPVGNISVHARGSVNGNGSSTGGWTAWAQQHEDPSDTPRTSYQPSQPVYQESYRPSTPQMPEENSYDGPSAAVPNWQEKEEEAELQMWFATVDEDK